MKKWISLLLVFICVTPIFIAPPAVAAEKASFTLEWDQEEIVIGQTATLSLKGQNMEDVYSYEAVFSYDPQKIQYDHAEAGTEGFPVIQAQDSGRIVFGFTRVGETAGMNGTATLGTLSFRGLSSGQGTVALTSVKTFNSQLSHSDVYSGNTASLMIQPSANPVPAENQQSDSGNNSPVVQKHNLGTVEVAGASTILVASQEKLEQLLSDSTGDVVIEIASIGTTSIKAVDIPAAFFAKLRDVQKNLVIQTDGARLILPNNALQLEGITGYVRISVTDHSPVKDAEPGFAVLSPGLEISITANSRPLSLIHPVKMYFDLNHATDVRKTGIYAFNQRLGKWEYAGGKLSQDRTTVTIDLPELTDTRYAMFMYNKTFADIAAIHWARDYIEVLAARHVVDGKNENNFDPGGNVTRAEFAAMAARVLNLAPLTSASGFKDVASTDWYSGVIAAAVNSGILEGDEAGIRPRDTISRQEMVVIAARILDKMEPASDVSGLASNFRFADQEAIAPWAQDAAVKVRQWGLVTGRGDNQFAPRENTTRAEAAAIVYRLLEKSGWL